MNKEIKMIVSDLDGTMLDKSSHISERTYKTLMKVKEMGIHFVPTTGRSISEIKLIQDEICMADYMIQCSGASVHKFGGDWEAVYKMAHEKETAKTILDYLYNDIKSLPVIVYDGQSYYQKDKMDLYYDTFDTPGGYASPDIKTLPDFYEYIDSKDCGPEIINVLFEDTAHRDIAWEHLKKMDGIFISSAYVNELEIINGNTNKGKAVLALADKLGIDIQQVVAMGDGDNDVTMIQVAGIGVAMKNAMDTPKAAADIITEYDNGEDGAARFIEELLGI